MSRGIWPVITDIEVCSWPATTDSMPMNNGLLLSAERYSRTGYWNSWIDSQRHMFGHGGVLPGGHWAGLTVEGVPLGCTVGILFTQVVVGPMIDPSCLVTSG